MPDETMDIGRVFCILIDGIYKRDDTIAVLRSRIEKLQEKLEAWRELELARISCEQNADNAPVWAARERLESLGEIKQKGE